MTTLFCTFLDCSHVCVSVTKECACVIRNPSAKQCDWLSHARPAPFPFPLFLFPGYIAQMCEVHLQYGNSTTKWVHFFRVNSTLYLFTLFGRKILSYYTCPGCGWPLCGEKCRDTKSHQRECSFFQVEK